MRSLRPGVKQWIFERSALDHTPSRLDGISLEQELESRKLTITYIRSLWLRVTGVPEGHDPEFTAAKGVITVGAILVHRFFMRRSVKDFVPELVSPTILFLASKIEEGPLRLRHIVNACLAKFEPGAQLWDPKADPDQQPLEYRRWEKEILATEEVALEALCFDMAVDQPWPALRRSVRGLDGMWAESTAAERTFYEGGEKVKEITRATEEVVTEIGWAMLNEGLLSPIGILHTESVLAFAVFVLIVAMVDRYPVSEALATGAEIASKFGLDLEFDEEVGARGEDVQTVKAAIEEYREYCKMGLIDRALPDLIVADPDPPTAKFRRRFKSKSAANGSAAIFENGNGANGA